MAFIPATVQHTFVHILYMPQDHGWAQETHNSPGNLYPVPTFFDFMSRDGCMLDVGK